MTVVLFIVVLVLAGARRSEVGILSSAFTYSQVLTRLQDADLVLPKYIIKPRSSLHLATAPAATPCINTDIPPQAIKHRTLA